MTIIGFHPTFGNQLRVVAEKVVGRTSTWIDLKIFDGTREIGEITVYNATSVEVLEPVA